LCGGYEKYYAYQKALKDWILEYWRIGVMAVILISSFSILQYPEFN